MNCLTHLPACNSSSSTPIRVYNEKPGGEFNCVNLLYTSVSTFNPLSLVVRLDGNTLDPAQYSVGVGNQDFTLIVDPANPKSLNSALESDELLRIDYNKADAEIGNDCITFL